MNKIIAAIKSYFKPQETQVDMLRYRTHKMGYMLCFLAIICDCVGFAFIYSTITAVDVFNGLDIIFNILNKKYVNLFDWIIDKTTRFKASISVI